MLASERLTNQPQIRDNYVSSATVRRSYVDLPGGQIHIRTAGAQADDSRPLMCFHMSPASGVIYENWLAEMGKDRLCVAPDTPGFGMSDPPETPPEISDYAKTMGQVMDQLDIQDADVIGYHTGSKICVELARQRPDRIKHLVLISAPVYPEAALTQQKVDFAHVPPDPEGDFLVSEWKGLLAWAGPGETLDDIMLRFPDFLKGGAKKAWGHRAAFAYTYPDHLKDVNQPILVLNTNDDLWDYTPAVAPHLINGRVLDLPDWGHGFLDQNTAEAAQIVREFLNT